MEQTKAEAAQPQFPNQDKRENMLLSFGINILLPIIILKKGADWVTGLSPLQVLLVALAFPIVYFLYDLYRRRKYNFISIIGFVSILMTGGIGLFQLDPIWIAITEAGVPAVIGIGVLLSTKTRFPLIRTFLYNKDLIEVEKIDQALEARGTRDGFEKLMTSCTWLLAGSFMVSAILNFILARIIVTTSPAVDASVFNNELSNLKMWSFPVIVIPCMIVMGFALWKLFAGLKQLTGLDLEEVIKQPAKG